MSRNPRIEEMRRNPPLATKRPDDMTPEEWVDWSTKWNSWMDECFGPFTPVGPPGW